ncbi:MAG: MoaD/ThiS family protein [Dehalococcoidia bacterium]|mgnify:CR=1 FL=1|nr:MoaD/ThiS family protein [Dehalococcoidia bacterium]
MPLVFIPSLMRNMTENQDRVPIEGSTLRQVVDNLDARYPGIKDLIVQDGRVRPGLALAINGEVATTGLMAKVAEEAEVQILPAIGGG